MKNDDLIEVRWREEALEFFRKIPMQYVSTASFETFYSNGYIAAKRSSQREHESAMISIGIALTKAQDFADAFHKENQKLKELVREAVDYVGIDLQDARNHHYVWVEKAKPVLGEE